MTRNQALELVALLIAHYPAQGKLSPDNINAYVSSLVLYPHELAESAIATARTSVFFPSVAQLIEAMVEKACALPPPEAAWNEIMRRHLANEWDTPMEATLKASLRAVGGTHALAHSKTYLVRREFLESYKAARKVVVDRLREVELPAVARKQADALLSAGKAVS